MANQQLVHFEALDVPFVVWDNELVFYDDEVVYDFE